MLTIYDFIYFNLKKVNFIPVRIAQLAGHALLYVGVALRAGSRGGSPGHHFHKGTKIIIFI